MHLVLLPGMDGTGELFAPLLDALPQGLITTVLRYPLDQCLDYTQLRHLLDRALPVDEPYAILAESFSGPMAIEHAAKQPEHLQALILCSSFARNPLPWPLRILAGLAGPLLFRLPLPSFAVRRYLLGAHSEAALLAQFQEALRPVSPQVLSHRLGLILRTDVRPLLKSVGVPTFYLGAAQDRLIRNRGLDEMLAAKPDLRWTILDGPHLLLQARPTESATWVSRNLLRCLEK